jgi:hypothetical protein
LGLPLFHFAGERRFRLFLRSRNNSVRETNAQPAPVAGLKKGLGVLPQQAEPAVSGIAGNRRFESLWEQRHCLRGSESTFWPDFIKTVYSTDALLTGSNYRIYKKCWVKVGLYVVLFRYMMYNEK